MPSAPIHVADVKYVPSDWRSRNPIILSPVSNDSENQSHPVWFSARGCDDHSRSSQACPVTGMSPSGVVKVPVTVKNGCE